MGVDNIILITLSSSSTIHNGRGRGLVSSSREAGRHQDDYDSDSSESDNSDETIDWLYMVSQGEKRGREQVKGITVYIMLPGEPWVPGRRRRPDLDRMEEGGKVKIFMIINSNY